MTQQQATGARQEWRANWPLVASAMAGLSFAVIPTATLGLFIEPLQRDFGWSRTQISAGLTIFSAITLPFTPFAGALVDRYGPRRVGMPAIGLTGLAFAAFALITGGIWQWFLAWTVYSFVALGIRTPVWNSAVSSKFTASRGLALAIVLAGLAVAQAIVPIAARWLVDEYSWRVAYSVLGLAWGGFAFLLVALFFHDWRSRPAVAASGTGEGAAALVPGGLTLGQAMRNHRVPRIALAIFLQSVAGAAISVHLIPLLTGAGITRAEAASVAAMFGVASLVGKLLAGWLMDRYQSNILPAVIMAMPGIGYFILLQDAGSLSAAMLVAVINGFAGGASLQIATYLTTRYAGVRHFGKIFGIVSSLLGLAGGLGPLVAGLIFDFTGSYSGLLLLSIGMMIVAGGAVFGLGPYPHFPAEPASESPDRTTRT